MYKRNIILFSKSNREKLFQYNLSCLLRNFLKVVQFHIYLYPLFELLHLWIAMNWASLLIDFGTALNMQLRLDFKQFNKGKSPLKLIYISPMVLL